MKKNKLSVKNFGFTLIELMVVLAIMTTVYTLVGPNILRSLDKVKQQAEIKELTGILKKISYKAFVNGREVQVKFTGSNIQYSYITSDKAQPVPSLVTKHFEQLSFPLQTLNYTDAGFTDLTSLKVLVAGELQYLSLREINSL